MILKFRRQVVKRRTIIYDRGKALSYFSGYLQEAHINETQYLEEYNKSVTDSDRYWSDIANKFITWDQPWTTCQT